DCREYANYFEQYERVICKRISDYSDKILAFESEKNVGFVFSSTSKRLSDKVSQFLSHIIMDKKSRCFLMVTGGKRELGALKQAVHELESRGFRVGKCSSPYLLKKKETDVEKEIADIVKRIHMYDSDIRISDIEECYRQRIRSSKPLRNRIRKETKKYLKYCRREKSGTK
ncbi:MAG: hypothetical protein J5983_06415, partial [Ruminococcus sp.]|nr:hypothetical protein [Ruminococcus sp.]